MLSWSALSLNTPLCCVGWSFGRLFSPLCAMTDESRTKPRYSDPGGVNGVNSLFASQAQNQEMGVLIHLGLCFAFNLVGVSVP
jgi:hypothetical protein